MGGRGIIVSFKSQRKGLKKGGVAANRKGGGRGERVGKSEASSGREALGGRYVSKTKGYGDV